MKLSFFGAVSALLLLGIFAAPGSAQQSQAKKQAVELLKAIETGNAAPVSVINPKKYIQHNPGAEDGLAGFSKLLSQLPKGSAKVNTVRVFQDGNFVFAHTEYNFFGPKVGFDIFRFENGKIVEHWDNLTAKAEAPNRSGHTQTDGPTQAHDLDKTEANKKRVRAFYEDILMQGRKDKLAEYFAGDNYIQHSAGLGDGSAFFGRMVEMVSAPNSPIKFNKIHRVLGEGDFVLVVSEGAFDGKPTAFYDLFRLENDKIAEHWDSMETVPALTEQKNDNGKFGGLSAAKGYDPAAEASVRGLMRRYADSVNRLDLNLASQVFLTTEETSFIHPRGHERGWDQIQRNFYQGTMGVFAERSLQPHDIAVHILGDATWVEFDWHFDAKLKDGTPLTTQGRESQVLQRTPQGWRIVQIHYSGLPVTGERQGF